MPQAPDVSLFTRYVLENPWPLAIVLLVIAAFLAWTGFREGIESRQKWVLIPLMFAIVIVAIGYLTVTPGEHARNVAGQLVSATVNKDLVTTDQLLATDAIIVFGSPTNPGFDREFIMERLDKFRDKFTIDSNSITMLKSFSESSDSAVVHMACWTTLKDWSSYPSPSQWVLKVAKQPDGSWKISHVTCVSVNNQMQTGNF